MPSLLSLLTLATTALAGTTWKPFSIPSLTSHQPNGNPDGQVNYYTLSFTLDSTNSGSKKTGYCWKSWGDNSWAHSEAYSLYVPTDTWFQCDSSSSSLGDGDSVFQFKLFPYFSIGNFSVEVKEMLGNDTSIYGWKHITNNTAAFTCTINPQQVDKINHASGDCSIPSGEKAFELGASLGEKGGWY